MKFMKLDPYDYKSEAVALDFFNTLELPVNIQKTKWLSDDGKCIVLYGVQGTPLTKVKNLTLKQKKIISEKVGAFLKQIRKLEPDFAISDETNRDNNGEALIKSCQKNYEANKAWLVKHFEKDIALLDKLLYEYFPAERKKLGDKLVFTHGDIWNPNVLIDDSDNVAIIDFGGAGYYEESTDFGFEDDELRNMVLDSYGAGETLRRKVELRHDMLYLATYQAYISWLYGDEEAIKVCVPIIRKIIEKYKTVL